MSHILTKTISSRSPLKKAVVVTVALAVWCVILWKAINVFAPNTMLGVFSSDAAVPVLMANDERPITIFNLYYYGAGRWGGWPFLIAQLVRRTVNYRWSDQSLFMVQALWVFLGILVIAGLSPGDRFPVALSACSRFACTALSATDYLI